MFIREASRPRKETHQKFVSSREILNAPRYYWNRHVEFHWRETDRIKGRKTERNNNILTMIAISWITLLFFVLRGTILLIFVHVHNRSAKGCSRTRTNTCPLAIKCPVARWRLKKRIRGYPVFNYTCLYASKRFLTRRCKNALVEKRKEQDEKNEKAVESGGELGVGGGRENMVKHWNGGWVPDCEAFVASTQNRTHCETDWLVGSVTWYLDWQERRNNQ